MARENQGLQYALIAFVLLTICLAVLTFFYFRQYQQMTLKAEANETAAATEKQKADDALKMIEDLKTMMGFAKDETLEKIDEQFKKDMLDYAGSYPENTRFYHQVVARQGDQIKALNEQIEEQVKTAESLSEQITALNAIVDKRIAPFQTAAAEAEKQKTAAETKFAEDRQRMKDDMTARETELAQFRTEYSDKVNTLTGQVGSLEKDVQELSGNLAKTKKIIHQITDPKPSTFQGEIRLVSQENRVVWIGLGRDDALQPQTNFSVYPAGAQDTTEAQEQKGKIEVTQILGSHLAEATILDDRPDDPILPGDKIFTPVWSVGEKRRFALAGEFDLDQNGQSDRELLETLIVTNGGAIAAKKDASGKREGTLSVNTRYLILGDPPAATASAEEIKDYQDMQDAAAKLKVDVIPVAQFLDWMGWKRQLQVLPFGQAGDRPFAVQPDKTPRVSGGKISDRFKPRKPPRSSGGSTF